MTNQATRQIYTPPPERIERRIRHKQIKGAEVILFDTLQGKPAAMGWRSSRQVKPAFRYQYRDEKERATAVGKFLEALKPAKGPGKSAGNKLFPVGTVLVSSWGYEQTNIDFYQVVAHKGKATVVIREIAQDSVPQDDGLFSDRGHTTARKDVFIGEEFERRVSADGYLSVSSFQGLRAWDGKPRYWSAYA